MADYFTKAKENWSGQVGSAGVTDKSVTTIPLQSASGLPTDTEIYLAIDRVDSSATKTPAKFEVVKGTVSGSNLTAVTRGVEGTAQAHSAGAVVEYLSTAGQWNDLYTGLTVEHSKSTGKHKQVQIDGTDRVDGTKIKVKATANDETAGDQKLIDVQSSAGASKASIDEDGDAIVQSLTIVSGVKVASIKDEDTMSSNSDTALPTQQSVKAYVDTNLSSHTGATTGHGATGAVVGTTNTQTLTNKTIVQKVVAYTPGAAATVTLDVATGGIHSITMPAGNITIAVSNEAVGQCFLVEITQDGTGSRTVTWFSTIKWAGGSAPTLTTTANKRDVFGFRVTGTDTYDGFVVGANL